MLLSCVVPRVRAGVSRASRVSPVSVPRRGVSSLLRRLRLDTKIHQSIDRKTKIVATIGPGSVDQVSDLLHAGMNVARINCSHGDETFYRRVVGDLRAAIAEVHARGADKIDFSDGAREDVCAIAFDIQGPKIRLGRFAADAAPAPASPGAPKDIPLEVGDRVVFTTDKRMALTGARESGIYVDYPDMADQLQPGHRIFFDDGLLGMQVKHVNASAGIVECVAENRGPLGERKGVTLPDIPINLPAVSEKDKKDLALARAIGADFIFASFIREASQVDEIRELVGPDVGIISKIENQQGVDNFDSILDASDGIMVARGDLGVAIPLERVFIVQKLLMAKSNLAGKPVICATQMLESMISNPRPTRAECVDVATAVLDGADCVMLSGETAKGRFPVETIKTMSRICQVAEASDDMWDNFNALQELLPRPRPDNREVLAAAAVHASFDQGAKMIVALTQTGTSAQLLAKHRPRAPILALTPSAAAARKLQVHRGVHATVVEDTMDVEVVVERAVQAGLQMGIIQPRDKYLVFLGSKIAPIKGDLASLHVLEVPDPE